MKAKRSRKPTGKSLMYRVVEISQVDEGSLERAVNEQVGAGWTFDGVQFAMRESSKRPSMAFVFFTREGKAPAVEREAEKVVLRPVSDAYERLRQLAEGGDES